MFDLLFPTRCTACGALGEGTLCLACQPGLPIRPPCEAAFLAGLMALDVYDSPLGKAVQRAKYQHDRALAVALAELLVSRTAWLLRDQPIDCVVPVPTPALRRVWRGFSLPDLLAARLARAMSKPLCDALYQRHGARQVASHGSQRRNNAEGRFRSRRPARGTVLLVDDVFTSGATASACAQELLGDQTTRVYALTLCVAQRRSPPAWVAHGRHSAPDADAA